MEAGQGVEHTDGKEGRMPKRIPIAAARRFAREYGCRQVIILAWDGKLTHCTTYGKSLEDCDQAAQGGNRMKAVMGWPESLMGEPSRVRALHRRIKELEDELRGRHASIENCAREQR